MNRRILPLIGSVGIFWLLFSLHPNSFLPAAIANAEQVSAPLSNRGLYQIARSVTVKIISDGSSASGTLIKKQGQTYTVLTSSHILLAGTSFSVQTPDGKTYPCSVAHDGAKKGTDLALLQFHSARDYAVASLGLTSKLSLNQPVVAAGFAQNIETLTFTTGQISLLPTQALKNGYQIGYTSNIQQGMSGGPIFNKRGEVIGVSSLSAHPLLNAAYIFEDGSLPSQEQIAEMRRASWGIPIQTVIQLVPEAKTNFLSTSYNVATLDKVKSVERVNSATSSRTDLPSINLVVQSSDDSPSERYVKQGQKQADSRDFKGAVVSYTQAINLDPKNANAYYWRGQAYSDLQEYDKGIKDLTRAIELTPDSESAFVHAMRYMIRGTIQFSKRDYKKAIRDFTKAIEFDNDPKNSIKGAAGNVALALRGRSHFELKDYALAIKDITQAFEDQDYSRTLEDYSYRGDAYNAIGDNQKAVEDWRKATQLGFVGQMENIAKRITVQIGVRGSNVSNVKPEGSGVIVAKQGKTYYVLTCDHVVPSKANYVVTTPDGKQHPVAYSTITRQAGVDLATLQFNSSENYEVATIAAYLTPPNVLRYGFTAGWAISGENRTNSTWQFTSGFLFSRDMTIDAVSDSSFMTKGYESVYTNFTQFGMSGGALLDIQGRLIGIHGQSIGGTYAENGEIKSEVEWGYSMGIPIQTFLGLTPQLRVDPKLLQISNVPPPASMPDSEQISSIQLSAKAAAFAPQYGDSDSASTWLKRGNRLWRQYGIGPDSLKNEALAAFNKAIKLNPNSYEAWYGRALVLDYQGKSSDKEAIKSLDRAIALKDDFYLAWTQRGQLLSHEGRTEEALSSFRKASALNSKEIYAYWWQGILLSRLKRPKEALVAYTQAINIFEASTKDSLQGRDSPHAARLYAGRGDTYRQLGDKAKAIEDYKRAVSLSPGDFSTHERLADLYKESGDGIRSLEERSRYFAGLADSFEINLSGGKTFLIPKLTSFYMKGLAHFLKGENSEAIESFTEVIKIGSTTSPDSSLKNLFVYWLGYYQRGRVLIALKKYSEGLSDFTEAINLGVNNKDILASPEKTDSLAEAYYYRGNTYANLNKFPQAVEDYTRSIELIPKNTNPYYQLQVYFERGVARNYLGQSSQAIEDFTRVTEINPGFAPAYRFRGLAYQKVGNSREASSSLQKAAELYQSQGNTTEYQETISALQKLPTQQISSASPTQPVISKPEQEGFNLAQEAGQLAQAQKYDLALQKAQKASELAPKNPQIWSLLGGLYMQTNNLDKGIEALQQSLKLDSKNAAALFALGSAFFQKGQYTTAISNLKLGLKINPNVPGALFELGNAHLALRQYSDALTQYSNAITQDKNFWPAISNIGLIKYEQGGVDEALRHWKMAASIDKKAVEPQMASAVAYYTRGELSRALTLGVAAIRADNRLGDLKFLKENLWGDRLLADTKKFLETSQMRAALNQKPKH